MAEQALTALAATANALTLLPTSADPSRKAIAAHGVLELASLFLAAVDNGHNEVLYMSSASLWKCTALPGSLLDNCGKLTGVQAAEMMIGAAAALATAAQMTSVALRLSVNSARLASAGADSSADAGGDASAASGRGPLTSEQAKELGTASVRAAGAVAARLLGMLSTMPLPWAATSAPLLAPVLLAYERCLALHPTVFRRAVPDALAFAVWVGTRVEQGEQGEGAVRAAAARLAAAAIVVAVRHASSSPPGSTSSASAGAGSLDGASAARAVIRAAGVQLESVQGAAVYSTVKCQSAAEFWGAFLAVLPAEGVAFSQPSEGLLTPSPSAQSDSDSTDLVRTCCARMEYCADVVRYMLSRPAGASPSPALPSPSYEPEACVLPLSAMLAMAEWMVDAPAMLATRPAMAGVGSIADASSDPALVSSLCECSCSLQAAGLRILSAACTAAPGQMRRYRTLLARCLLRALHHIITCAAVDAHGYKAGLQFAGAALGHAAPPAMPVPLSSLVEHGLLHGVLVTWQAYCTSVGLGALDSVQTGTRRLEWQADTAQPGSCPEASKLVHLTMVVATSALSGAAGCMLCDSEWVPLAGPLQRAMSSAKPVQACVTFLACALRSCCTLLSDGDRVRAEQCGLVLASRWLGPVGGMPAVQEHSGGQGMARAHGRDGGVRGGLTGLQPQPKRIRLAGDAERAFSAPPQAFIKVQGAMCAAAELVVQGIPTHHSDMTSHLTVHLSPSLASAVAGLLSACLLHPWAGGSHSPFTAYLRTAVAALAGRVALTAGAVHLPTVAAMDAVLADRIIVGAIPATLPPLPLPAPGHMYSPAPHQQSDDGQAGTGGAGAGAQDVHMQGPGFGSARPGLSLPPPPPPPSAHTDMYVLGADISSLPSTTSARVAAPVPVSEAEAVRLAGYDKELEDFPDL